MMAPFDMCVWWKKLNKITMYSIYIFSKFYDTGFVEQNPFRDFCTLANMLYAQLYAHIWEDKKGRHMSLTLISRVRRLWRSHFKTSKREWQRVESKASYVGENKETKMKPRNTQNNPSVAAAASVTTAACFFPFPHGLSCHIPVIGDGCCSVPACLIERKTNWLLQIMGKVRRNTINSQWSF